MCSQKGIQYFIVCWDVSYLMSPVHTIWNWVNHLEHKHWFPRIMSIFLLFFSLSYTQVFIKSSLFPLFTCYRGKSYRCNIFKFWIFCNIPLQTQQQIPSKGKEHHFFIYFKIWSIAYAPMQHLCTLMWYHVNVFFLRLHPTGGRQWHSRQQSRIRSPKVPINSWFSI